MAGPGLVPVATELVQRKPKHLSSPLASLQRRGYEALVCRRNSLRFGPD
jgi:hypothetical protein